MKKRIFAAGLLTLSLAFTGFANDNSFRSLELKNRDASTMLINMDKEMKLTCADDSLVVTTPDYEVKFALNNLAGWGFSSQWSSLSFTEPSTPEPGPVVVEPAGDGTYMAPYNVSRMLENPEGGQVWITGYIMGSFTGTVIDDAAVNLTDKGHLAGNILLAADPSHKSADQMIAVQLNGTSPVRPDLNLMDNVDNIGKEVAIKGTLAQYGGRLGMTKPTKFAWGNIGEEETAIEGVDAVEAPFAIVGNTIVLGNLPAGATVVLSDLSGRTVASYPAAAATISLDNLVRGIYLLTVNGQTVKISVNR